MNVATNLQSLLEERGWTPERVAVASQEQGGSLQVEAIKQWLRGTRIPTGPSAVALANALGCTTDAILRGPAESTESLKAAS